MPSRAFTTTVAEPPTVEAPPTGTHAPRPAFSAKRPDPAPTALARPLHPDSSFFGQRIRTWAVPPLTRPAPIRIRGGMRSALISLVLPRSLPFFLPRLPLPAATADDLPGFLLKMTRS